MLLYSSLQIDLPEAVVKRYDHSMTTYEISNGNVWIAVTGGFRKYDQSHQGGFAITGFDVTFVIELGMTINITVKMNGLF